MRFNLDAASCWWTVPVPVKRSRFAAMDPSHAVYNVETDLAAIRAFSLTVGEPDGDHLHADLQTTPTSNVWRRLGSGRSGVYRDAYLKGMGRTTLAANFTDDVDRYHSSGHLLPSAAVREYLVSRVLEAHGAGDTITPCTGLLMRELDAPIDAFLDTMLPEAGGRFATIDRRLQAISVKRADFARYSNFVWALDHLGTPQELADVLFRMHAYFLPPGERPEDGVGTSPGALARAMASAVERGLRAFAAFTRAGVCWGSLHNNFTADGRFLDLELPMVLMQPCFGVIGEGEALGTRYWMGLEVFAYLRQTRAFVSWLRARLRYLARHVLRRGVPRDYALGLARAIDEALPREHVLWSRDAAIDAAVGVVVEALGLDRQRTAMVRVIARRHHDAMFLGHEADWSDLRWRKVPIDVAAPEPGCPRWIATPEFLADVCARPSAEADAFNDGLRRVDASTCAGELFERTRQVAHTLTPAMELAS